MCREQKSIGVEEWGSVSGMAHVGGVASCMAVCMASHTFDNISKGFPSHTHSRESEWNYVTIIIVSALTGNNYPIII